MIESTAPIWLFFTVAALCVVLVGIAKAGFAGGVGLIAVPLMSLVTSPIYAAGILLPLLLACDVISIYYYRRTCDWTIFWKLMPGAIVGIALAAFFLWQLSGHRARAEFFMNQVIGWSSLLFVAFQVTRARLARRLHHRHPPAPVAHGLGVTAGFTSTLSHAGGPPVTMFMLTQQLDRQIFVGTTVWLFGVINFIKLGPYLALGMVNLTNVRVSLMLMPCVPVGVVLGFWLNRTVSPRVFNAIVMGLLTIVGVQMIFDGFWW